MPRTEMGQSQNHGCSSRQPCLDSQKSPKYSLELPPHRHPRSPSPRRSKRRLKGQQQGTIHGSLLQDLQRALPYAATPRHRDVLVKPTCHKSCLRVSSPGLRASHQVHWSGAPTTKLPIIMPPRFHAFLFSYPGTFSHRRKQGEEA